MAYMLKTTPEDGRKKFVTEKKNGAYYYTVIDTKGNTKILSGAWVKENIDKIENAGLSGNSLYYKSTGITKVKDTKTKKVENTNNKFNYSKLVPVEFYALDTRIEEVGYMESSCLYALVINYGNDVLYMPNIKLNKLKTINSKLYEVVEKWIINNYGNIDLTKNNMDIRDAYYTGRKGSTPYYKIENKTLYNIFSYINKKDRDYRVEYGCKVFGTTKYKGELLYKNENVVSFKIDSNEDYSDVWYKVENGIMEVDMVNNNEHKITSINKIVDATSKYIVGIKFIDREYYSYRVIRKSDMKTIFVDPEKHYDNGVGYRNLYKLIADRYMAVSSLSYGVIDLDTEQKIECDFANSCSDFICNITHNTFTSKDGVFSINKLPDLSWTGYSTLEFIKKFKGFIPKGKWVGSIKLDGSGGCQTYSSDMLVFKNLMNGIFYFNNSKKTELFNIVTGEVIKVDEVMLKWILKKPDVVILDKKPAEIRRISILEELKKGRKVYGLLFGPQGYLKYENTVRELSLNFLKENIRFTKNNLVDVVFKITGYDKENRVPKGNVEIRCKASGKTLIIETDYGYTKFEVADIK